MTEANPLVAGAGPDGGAFTGVDSVDSGFSGGGIFENAEKTVSDAAGGEASAFTMGVDIASTGLDLLGTAMDPLGALASAGVGWLIEHIGFLHEGLDKLAGDPEDVTAKSQTWKNISQSLQDAAQGYRGSARQTTACWTSSAGQAYQASATGFERSIQGAAGHANSAASAMTVAAGLVGVERGLIRDMISGFVGGLIAKAIAALATSWCSFGASVAAFIADTVVEATALTGKITSKIAALVSKLGRLGREFEESAQALGKMGRALEQAAVKLDQAAGTIGRSGGQLAGNIRQMAPAAPHIGDGGGSGGFRHVVEQNITQPHAFDLSNYRPTAFEPGWNNADSVKVGMSGLGGVSGQLDSSEEARQDYDESHPGGVEAANDQAPPYDPTPTMRPAPAAKDAG